MEKKKRNRKPPKVYTFEDLMRVRRAAILTSHILGSKLEGFTPALFCGGRGYWNNRRSAGCQFVSIEEFMSYTKYFKALLPGLTQANMRLILLGLRDRREEFARRKTRRDALSHISEKRWAWNPYWVTRPWDYKNSFGIKYEGLPTLEVHSLIPGRLFTLDNANNYRKITTKYITRNSRAILSAIESLKTAYDKAKKGMTNYYYDYGAYPNGIEDVKHAGMLDSDHRHQTSWISPYKTKEGRAGLMVCVQVPRRYYTTPTEEPHNGRPVMDSREAHRIAGKPKGFEYTLVCDWNAIQHHEVDGVEQKRDDD